MTDGEGTVFEKDAGKVVLGEQTGRDGSSRIQVVQFSETASGQTALRGVLGLGVLDGIFKVNVGVDVSGSGRREGSSGRAALVGLGRKGRGDGIGRGRKTGVMLLDGQRPRGHGSEAVFAGPEVVAGFGDVDGLRHSSQGQSDARVGIGTGRSHVVDKLGGVLYLCFADGV